MLNTMLTLIGIFGYLTLTAISTAHKYENTINKKENETKEESK